MIRALIRFVVSAIVLWFTAMVIPGVSASLIGAFFAALVIAAIGWIAESLLGDGVSRQNRGFVGFVSAAIVIWLAAQIVPGFSVSIMGALLASFVIGLVDLLVPTTIR
ncbi:MAG: phage holin family protein [Bacillota bacterium]|nr:phage holin family protein [Bacillota bacterium]